MKIAIFAPCLIALASLVSGHLYANGSGTGRVTSIGGQFANGSYPSAVYFGISPAPVGKPACSTSTSYQFAFDPNTPDGKSLYAALLAAKAADLPINVYGSGGCVLGQPLEGVVFWKLDAES